MGLAINEQTYKPEFSKEVKKLSEISKKYVSLIGLQKQALFVMKAYKWLVRLKLKWLLERTYRKYESDALFRNAMEGVFLQVYEKISDSISEEEFVKFIASLGLTKKTKELLKEDAEEVINTYKLKCECEKNRKALEAAFLKFQERFDEISAM